MYHAGEGGNITSDDPKTTPEQPRPLLGRGDAQNFLTCEVRVWARRVWVRTAAASRWTLDEPGSPN